MYCQEPEEANRIARRIFFALAVDNERWVIMQSRGVITMHNWSKGWPSQVELKVQIVLRLVSSFGPLEIVIWRSESELNIVYTNLILI